MSRVELLAPAGDAARLEMAIAYGADAVYFAGEEFGMRAFAGNFGPEALEAALRRCKSAGVAAHVTCNIMPRNEEMARLPAFLERLAHLGADALILADLGVLELAKRYAPGIPIHISTQANVVNWQSAAAWQRLGAKRVILARELSLPEIREIRAKTAPELELEVFVHGAMCVSYSGRCLLSAYMTGRDANRGACAQPCRYRYALVEEKRPGEYYPIEEDGAGSYIMNARDLCMIEHIPALLEAGVSSLKIEGRAKSAYYTAVVTGAYRAALDAALAGAPLDPVWKHEVETVSHRPYSTGFFFGEPGQSAESSQYIRDYQVLALVEGYDPKSALATLSLRNKFQRGDAVELIGPGLRPHAFSAPPMQTMEGEALNAPRHPEMRFQMRLPMELAPPPQSFLRARRGEGAAPAATGT